MFSAFKKKFYLKIGQDAYIDFQSGETFSTGGKKGEGYLKKVRSGIVISFVDPKSQRYLVRGAPMSMKYIYHDKNSGKYYLSGELDTSFLGEILRLEYQENAFVVYGQRLVLFFYGDNTIEYHALSSPFSSKKGKEEVTSFAEGVFQGVPYREVSIDEAYSLVVPSKKKLYAALVLLALVLGYFVIGGGGEEERSQFVIPKFSPTKEEINSRFPPVEIPLQIRSIYSANVALEKILSKKMKPLSMAGEYQFSQNGATERIFYFYPAVGTFAEGNYYVKEEQIQFPPIDDLKMPSDDSIPDIRKVLGLRSWVDCLKFYRKLDVESRGEHDTVFVLRGRFPIETVARFLRGSLGCPVSFAGSIQFDGNAFSREADLRVHVYDADYYWKKYSDLNNKRQSKIKKWRQEREESLIAQAKAAMNVDN